MRGMITAVLILDQEDVANFGAASNNLGCCLSNSWANSDWYLVRHVSNAPQHGGTEIPAINRLDRLYRHEPVLNMP
ncbi:hypothetical protein O9992_12890 [Vibrio lentus]|nr:hypothetical protein [Vibrio lentus]